MERKVFEVMVEFIFVHLAHEVPGLDDAGLVEERHVEGDVPGCFSEAVIVFIGVDVNVKGMSVIDAGDSELEDLHFLEEVRHEFGCLVGKHDVVVLD